MLAFPTAAVAHVRRMSTHMHVYTHVCTHVYTTAAASPIGIEAASPTLPSGATSITFFCRTRFFFVREHLCARASIRMCIRVNAHTHACTRMLQLPGLVTDGCGFFVHRGNQHYLGPTLLGANTTQGQHYFGLELIRRPWQQKSCCV